jgi:hypothetical protein
MPAPVGIDEEDALDELPPLDGDVREAPAAELEEPLDDEDGDASLDDTTGEDDPADADGLDLERGERDRAWLEEPADAPDLDLGDAALVDLGDERSSAAEDGNDADGPDAGEEDDPGFGNAPERGGLDGGIEGPLGEDDELREADLPPLDADAEGDLEDAALVEAGFAADEPVGLPWAAEPWSRVGAPVELAAATAVACAPRGALVAGRTDGGVAQIVRVDLEGTSQSLATSGLDAGTVRALAVERDVVAALVDGGRMRVSRDGGATFSPFAEGVIAAGFALVSGVLWVRTRAGRLVTLGVDGARVPQAALDSGPSWVAAMAGDEGASGVAALVADEAGKVSGLLRGGSAIDSVIEALDVPEATQLPAVLAVRGGDVAYAGSRGGVVRRNGDGSWSTHVWEGRITALAFVDDAGTLVAATYSDVDDTTALVLLEKRSGEPELPGPVRVSVVARIGPAPKEARYAEGSESVSGNDLAEGQGVGDGRVLALAYDDARGVVWVAGGFGVAAFAAR